MGSKTAEEKKLNMKNLRESIEYTKAKKSHQVSSLEYSFKTESVDALENYLITGKKRGSASNQIERLGIYNHWNFINNFILVNEKEYQLLSKSTYYHLEHNNWCFFLGDLVEGFDSATMFKETIKHLGQLFYLQQFVKAVSYGKLIVEKLYGKHYKGGTSIPIHPWFMLQLFCNWQGIELEQRGTYYPDNMFVYDRALKYWNTKNRELLSDIVDELTAFHIKESDEYAKTDEYGNEEDTDFTSADYFIFPIEILMWLAIRREMGLPEYEPSPKNELMQLEINRLPEKVVPWPTDELVEKCKAKLKADNPEIDFELDF
mgnify:CR=1 FL=1